MLIESNYDPEMLDHGPYPWPVKQRIRGHGGHLSNVEAADLLDAHGRNLAWACLGHMSEDNNSPDRAMATHRAVLGSALPLHLAGRHAATDVLEL